MSVLGVLRRRVLTPDVSATRLEVRGFHIKSPAAQDLLETVGRTFLQGYGAAAAAGTAAAAEPELEEIPSAFRGFAYEGAAMCFAIRDALPFGGGKVAGLLAGRGDRHVYMAYVGVGWAMARLPRMRWSRLHAPHRLLRWLVLDGYGFHQAYFRTERYVHEMYREPDFPWPDDDAVGYAAHAIDQGIGRAMWFVGGADPAQVARLLDRFPAPRQPDLYSGAGLAATYAGGADEDELREFWRRAGDHRPHVAQGSAFGAAARVRAGLVVAHNELATRVFCRMSPAEAAAVTEATRPGPTLPGEPPAYELWRQRTRNEFVAWRHR